MVQYSGHSIFPYNSYTNRIYLGLIVTLHTGAVSGTLTDIEADIENDVNSLTRKMTGLIL